MSEGHDHNVGASSPLRWAMGGAALLAVIAGIWLLSGDKPAPEPSVVSEAMPDRPKPESEPEPELEPEPESEPKKPVVLVDPPPQQPPLDSTWGDERKVLRLLAWPDYFDPKTLARFEKKTGIKIEYKTFESLDALAHAIKTGKPVYDVVVPSSATFEQAGGSAAFRRLYTGHLPNRKNIDPALAKILAELDPGNNNAAPYLWGTAGVAYHTKTVQRYAGKKAPMDSWQMVFEPRWAERLVDCGLYFPSSPDEMMDLGLIALGKSPYTERAADYVALETRLLKLRPFITGFHSDGKVNDLIAGEACAVVGWSVNLMVAHVSSGDDKGLRAVDYVVPKEGSLLWFDLLAMPKNAVHPGNAHKFIDFMMTPEAGAESSNYLWYASANAASKDKIADPIASHPGLYPKPAIIAKSYVHRPLSRKAQRLRDGVWEKFSKVPATPQAPEGPADAPDSEPAE